MVIVPAQLTNISLEAPANAHEQRGATPLEEFLSHCVEFGSPS